MMKTQTLAFLRSHSRQTLRHVAAIVAGFLGYLLLPDSKMVVVFVSEALRGVGTTLLSPGISLGMAAAQAYRSLPCLGVWGTSGRFVVILVPHAALGWLWQRYQWRGGLAALGLHSLWQLGITIPRLWILPAIGFVLVYALLLWDRLLPTSASRTVEAS